MSETEWTMGFTHVVSNTFDWFSFYFIDLVLVQIIWKRQFLALVKSTFIDSYTTFLIVSESDSCFWFDKSFIVCNLKLKRRIKSNSLHKKWIDLDFWKGHAKLRISDDVLLPEFFDLFLYKTKEQWNEQLQQVVVVQRIPIQSNRFWVMCMCVFGVLYKRLLFSKSKIGRTEKLNRCENWFCLTTLFLFSGILPWRCQTLSMYCTYRSSSNDH